MIGASVGDVTPTDVQDVSATKDAIIVGFNVKVDREATELAQRLGVEIDTFNIILPNSKEANYYISFVLFYDSIFNNLINLIIFALCAVTLICIHTYTCTNPKLSLLLLLALVD